jgi:hypothetical protein
VVLISVTADSGVAITESPTAHQQTAVGEEVAF